MAASLLIAASRPQQISDREFEKLMRALVSVSTEQSQVQPATTTICINSKLGQPTLHSRAWREGMPKNGALPQVLRDAGFNAPVARAMASKLVASRQTRMPPLPPGFVVVAGDKVPRACVIDHAAAGGDNSAVMLTFTRPVFAKAMHSSMNSRTAPACAARHSSVCSERRTANGRKCRSPSPL